MTKIKSTKGLAKARPGPKPKPESEKALKKTVSLQPATHDGLMTLGEGILSRGIEVAYRAAIKRVVKAGR